MTPQTAIKEFELCEGQHTFVYRYEPGREWSVACLLNAHCWAGLISFANFQLGMRKVYPPDEDLWR